MIKVGVLRGGPSTEYEASLASGAAILSALGTQIERYEPVDIYIDRKGLWHQQGREKKPEVILAGLDLVWNALHGAYGEDGTVASGLTDLGVPFTGSNALSQGIAINKALARTEFKKLGIRTPQSILITEYTSSGFPGSREEYAADSARMIFNTMPPPWVVKPKSSGGSVNTHFVPTLAELPDAIFRASSEKGDILVEQYLFGPEVTVGLVDDFRGKKQYFLPAVEIKKPGKIWDMESRLAGTHRFESVGKMIDRALLESLLSKAYEHLNLSGYATADFIVTPRGPYLLEIDSQPHLHPHAYVPYALSHVGATLADFVHHVAEVALKRK